VSGLVLSCPESKLVRIICIMSTMDWCIVILSKTESDHKLVPEPESRSDIFLFTFMLLVCRQWTVTPIVTPMPETPLFFQEKIKIAAGHPQRKHSRAHSAPTPPGIPPHARRGAAGKYFPRQIFHSRTKRDTPHRKVSPGRSARIRIAVVDSGRRKLPGYLGKARPVGGKSGGIFPAVGLRQLVASIS